MFSDYGYQHSDGFTGACVHDDSVTLDPVCTGGEPVYSKSQGYRRVAGDVCSGGVEDQYAPQVTGCGKYVHKYIGHCVYQ